MSKMRRGNSVRPEGGARRSNVAGFPVYPETLRPGQGADGRPIEGESSAVPPPVILNGSALPKAAAVVVEIPSANDDAAPDSSTRSKDEAAVAKELSSEPPPRVEEASVEKVEKIEKEEAKAKESTVKMRTDRPERPERRSRDRGKGKGRSAAPPPVAPIVEEPKVSSPPQIDKTADKSAAAEVAATPEKAAAPVDLDDRFFAEGVDSEQEMLAASAKSARPSLPIEDEIDPKILLKLHPDVRARRAKYGPIVKWVGIGCVVLLGAAGLVRYRNAQSSQEAADRDMAAYAAAHTYTEPTDKPPPPLAPTQAAPVAAATAAAAPADSAAIPPPADTAAANPAGDKALLGPESKTVAAAAPGAPATPGAAAGSAQTDTETPPAKTAQQEKRDAQTFLDRGAFGRATEAGERSVALDPTDGEAWLLLGAAYQSQGRAGDAKRSFNNCLKQGKKGPLGECRAMLQ